MQEEFNVQELKERLYHVELMNKLLKAENVELKGVIAEIKKIPKKKNKTSIKDKLRNTLVYRALRKIKHAIEGN